MLYVLYWYLVSRIGMVIIYLSYEVYRIQYWCKEAGISVLVRHSLIKR